MRKFIFDPLEKPAAKRPGAPKYSKPDGAKQQPIKLWSKSEKRLTSIAIEGFAEKK